MPQPDSRSPWVVDTRELSRQAGSMRQFSRKGPVPDGFSTDLIGVPAGSELSMELRLEAVTEGVLASGTVVGAVRGECGRCLREIDEAREFEFQELYAYPDSTTDATTDDEEVSRLEGDLLDLEPVIRDAVLLGLPSNPVCRPDCPGLCPECGARLDEVPADHRHDAFDPRWGALAQLAAADEGGRADDNVPGTAGPTEE